MGLFGRKKKEGEVQARPRSRPRAAQAPPGWVTVQALVDRHEQERTFEHIKLPGTSKQPVYKTSTTYVLLDQQGEPFEISVEQRLRAPELPKLGERLTVAYDPQEPSTFVVIEDEKELARRRQRYLLRAVREGAEAPCEVLSARVTGRVSRHPEKSPAPETQVVVRVSPPGEGELELRCTVWDREMGLAPGVRGVLLYHPSDLDNGYAVFAKQSHRAMGGDPIQNARDEMVTYWMDPYWDSEIQRLNASLTGSV